MSTSGYKTGFYVLAAGMAGLGFYTWQLRKKADNYILLRDRYQKMYLEAKGYV